MSIKVEVWGDYALFTRPEMKVERVSYDVMTPSAARGILESIFWHPGLCWHIDKIFVMNLIAFTSIRRNEVKSKISARNLNTAMNGSTAPLYICTSEDIQQRASLLLKNVRYVIEAHFDITDKAAESDNPGKFQDIIKRRLEKGQFYHQPYLGCREFPAHFIRHTGDKPETVYQGETKDLGWMLYDIDYSDKDNIQPKFFRAELKNGVLDLTDCEVKG